MRKNGFTLIELLAVIVVLAIITLIATPVVMDVIKNVEKAASERSAENYVSSVERLIITERLDGNIIQDGTYEINSDGNLVINGVVKVIEMSGKKPSGGTITILDGVVSKESTTTITVGNYDVTYDANGRLVATESEGIVITAAENQFYCTLLNGSSFAVGSKYLCQFNSQAVEFYVLESIEAPEEDKDLYSYTMKLIPAQDAKFEGLTLELDGMDYDAYVISVAGEWGVEYSQLMTPTYEQLYAINNSENLPSWLHGDYWVNSQSGDVYIVDNNSLVSNAELDGYHGIRPVLTFNVQP